jgi:glycosyltransferase involved in cell wall biosynthesis
MRLFYWIHHTGQYDRNTGVQRVVRNLAAALQEAGHDLVPVRWCTEREAIVRAEPAWLEGLARFGGPVLEAPAEAGIPLHLSTAAGELEMNWLLIPEVPHVGGEDAPSLPVVFDYARFYGLRSASVFYDLIPLRVAGYEGARRAHEAYVRSLVAADLVSAISAHSADDLRRWWSDEGYEPPRLPYVVATPLAAEVRGLQRVVERTDPAPPIRFTALGTVEPRKNQVEVMRAFKRLRTRRTDLDLRLDVVGGIHAEVARAVDELAEGDGIRVHDYVSDERARALVAESHATVFMSLNEGFGLPIAESLWLATPCLCSDHGAMGEIAAGGGCLTVEAADGHAIEMGLERLAIDGELRRRLVLEASERPLRLWRDYASDLVGALEQAPLLRQVVVIEGTRGDPKSGDTRIDSRIIRRLHWRPECDALLPGTRDTPQLPRPGDGYLHDLWAVVRGSSTAGGDELSRILDEASGLGLRVALEPEFDTPPRLAAVAEVTVFETAAERDEALEEALRTLSRTVGVRARFDVAANGVSEILRRRERRISSSAVDPKPSRLYYWVGMTVGQPFNTGVQRVTRRLGAALQQLGIEIVPIKWNPTKRALSPISDQEAQHLARWNGPVTRPRPLPSDLAGEWLFNPEIALPSVSPDGNLSRYGRSIGMRVAAIFYDLIPAKMPENYPPKALQAFADYWRSFAEVDLALPISWSVASDLRSWLQDVGLRPPRLSPCVLAGNPDDRQRVGTSPARGMPGEALRLLAVGTWEPRKNYPRLLRALTSAQQRASRPIELTIVGRRAGFDKLDAEIERLAAAASATLHGHVEDDELRELHERASATVFASWEEGFGLPVVESLWQGRPCLCHAGSAMAELIPGGGVLAIDMLDEAAIADAMVRLADEPKLLERLGQEAVERPIRTWEEYAEDVTSSLSRTASAPGWRLPAVGKKRPLLTCAITTYNRAEWLKHSLPRLLEVTEPWRDIVEVVVCDNASTDDTPDVVARFRGEANFASHRNATNVGMLGNLGVTARSSRGAFVWLLGDDDLLIRGALENVLEGLAKHPDVEMAYLNYAYTQFDEPAQLDDVDRLVANATPIADGGPNRYVSQLRNVAGLNENVFTAIYTCVFRRDHALRAYQLDTRGAPFSSLATCVPSSVYALAALQDRPAWWVGEPAVVVNMNVSWLRWALLWHLERMPDLFDEAERQGIDGERLDAYRLKHLAEAERWVRAVYFDAEDAIRHGFSLARLIERSKHLPEFRERHLSGIRRAYEEAWAADRVTADALPPGELFRRYGL